MDIYNFHPKTGEFIRTCAADPDPLQKEKWLVPAHATTIQPPQPGENQAAVFRDGAWSLVADWRGHKYWLADRSHHTINELGIDPPADALDAEPPVPAADRRKYAKTAIDTAAGTARQRYVSAGQLVEEEYRLALQQTKDWRAAGNPAEQVPPAIQDWADATGMTAEQAASSIEQTAAAWETVLLQVRQIRLAGKAAIDAAADTDDFAAIAKQYIDQLEAMQP